jgi:serine/threonine protein kinase, bacterial
MAAERFSGGRGGPAADVYSLTCLLYECLTGRAPFEAGDVRQMMGAHMFSPPPRPSIMRRGINRAFDDVVAKGMAKQPADRYATAGELARAAAAAISDATPAPVPVPPAPPSHTRQFSAVDPNPARTGYQQAFAPMPPPAAPEKKSRFSPTQVALVAATIVMFAAAVVLATVLVFGDHGDGSAPQSRLAAPPPETTTVTTTPSEESTSATPSTSPTTPTTPSPSTRSEPISGVSGTDALGFVGHTARCDPGNTPAAAIRTANSIAVVCESGPGRYYYRGERLRDGANLELSNATPSGRGFTATNPADGARYEVQPDMLTILSRGGVDSAEPALEYGSDSR